jgi:hypothetical protein
LLVTTIAIVDEGRIGVAAAGAQRRSRFLSQFFVMFAETA